MAAPDRRTIPAVTPLAAGVTPVPAAAPPRAAPPPDVPGGLDRRLFEEAYAFDFFQAVRILERLEARRVPVGHGGPPRTEIVRFRSHLSLGFPASSLYELL